MDWTMAWMVALVGVIAGVMKALCHIGKKSDENTDRLLKERYKDGR